MCPQLTLTLAEDDLDLILLLPPLKCCDEKFYAVVEDYIRQGSAKEQYIRVPSALGS